MKTSSRELKRVHYLIVFWLFLLYFIPGMVAGEETPVPNTSTLLKSRLKTVIVTDYYPYTFVNKEGVPDGFSVNLANAVAKVMGMDLEIKVDTWERAMLRLETGEIDFLPMMAYSKERDKVFDFSVPHTIAFDAFFTRKDSKRINSTEGLKGQTVIVMKGDQAHDYLLSSSFVDSEHLILIDSLPEALRLLSSKKGDAALMPRLVGLTLMNDLNLTNLTQSPVVVESYNRPFSFAVKDGDLLLLERLNQGLSIVKKTGQYREIYDKWFGALEPKELSLKSVLKYIAGLLLAFLLIGSVFAMWTFSMRKQVVSRTKELADEIIERKNAEMRFRQVVDTIHSAKRSVTCRNDSSACLRSVISCMIECRTVPPPNWIQLDDTSTSRSEPSDRRCLRLNWLPPFCKIESMACLTSEAVRMLMSVIFMISNCSRV
jgi:ABC-type amino acid transport substrate-binding protein